VYVSIWSGSTGAVALAKPVVLLAATAAMW
jgi:hypothetical protein